MPETKSDTKSRLEAAAAEKNLLSKLSDTQLSELAARVIGDYEIDERSRSSWLDHYEKSMKLVEMIKETKNTPWVGASNIIYPLIATAAIQFSARALPSIIQNSSIVKGKAIGKDDGVKVSKADRIGEHMSYQLLEEMHDWVDDMDRLLTTLAITGTEFKKTWYDPTDICPVSEFISAKNIVVNQSATSLERAPRITQIFELLPHEIEERIRSGRFIDFQYGEQAGKDSADLDSPHIFLEQHRRWDIDEDGYPEPIIVTLHKTTQKIVRIIANFDIDGIRINSRNQAVMIKPVQYFTKYSFLRSFNGDFYDIGYGKLLFNNNEIIDSLLNQLIDAGTDQITGGGLIAGDINIKGGKTGGEVTFSPGEYKKINMTGDDIRKRIWTRTTSQPSAVSFSLLGMLIESSEKLASVTDALTGTPPPVNTPATTTLSMIEQGLKVFGAIYGRIHRSLTQEFKKLYRLNRLFLSDEVYYRIMDNEKAIRREDYDSESCDVVPVSDPNNLSDAQKMMKAEALWQLRGQGLNDEAIKRRYLEALQIGDIDELIPDEKAAAGPSPEVQLEMEKLTIEREKLEIDRFRADMESIRLRADALRLLAEAESKEAGTQMQDYQTQLRDLESEIWMLKRGIRNGNTGNGEGGMAGASSNTGIPEGDREPAPTDIERDVVGINA